MESPLPFDVLLTVATKVEGLAVRAAVKSLAGHDAQPYRGKYHDLGILGGARVAMAQTQKGTGGAGGSAVGVSAAINDLAPAYVLAVGIAFGTAAQKFGTVLVSEQLYLYESQRHGLDPGGAPKIVRRGDKVSASQEILGRLRVVQYQAFAFEVEFGLILTGEKLVDSIEYREALMAGEDDAIGGEMEGGGVYSAAQIRGLEWCIVKAVCDHADGKKGENKEQRQGQAAKNAATFVITAILQSDFRRKARIEPESEQLRLQPQLQPQPQLRHASKPLRYVAMILGLVLALGAAALIGAICVAQRRARGGLDTDSYGLPDADIDADADAEVVFSGCVVDNARDAGIADASVVEEAGGCKSCWTGTRGTFSLICDAGHPPTVRAVASARGYTCIDELLSAASNPGRISCSANAGPGPASGPAPAPGCVCGTPASCGGLVANQVRALATTPDAGPGPYQVCRGMFGKNAVGEPTLCCSVTK